MVAGIGLLLVSGMGIVGGWQPMPDGSASYECVIQLEPELVSMLEGGGSIPLSIDVPDHVRPIKRVRIVVGTGGVPQQSLVTNLKPWPGDEAKQSREGIIETQYILPNSAGDRYPAQQAQSQQVLPPNDYGSKTQEAFARSLQNGGQAVRDAANQATQDILPPDPGRSLSDTVDRTGQHLGSEIRNVGETVRSDIRQLFGSGSAGEVTPNRGVDSPSSQILPPGSAPTPVSDGRNTPVDDGEAVLPPVVYNNNRRVDQPIGSNQAGDWQSRGVAAPDSAAGDSLGTFNGARSNSDPSRLSDPNFNTDPRAPRTGPSGGSPPAFHARGSSVIPPSNRYPDSIPAPERNGLEIADTRNGIPEGNQSADSGPNFPPFTPAVSGDSRSAMPTTPVYQGQSNVPEIRRGMLDGPAGAELQGANGQPIAGEKPSTATTAGSQNLPTSTDFGWNTQTSPQPQTQQPVVQPSANPAPMFPLLLSWVLLSGSGAGNLYLFWSYLDIRNKYRDVLYEASRKITGRHGRD